jgi:(p)ppGpp synthase/HD superfamily hydrolase
MNNDIIPRAFDFAYKAHKNSVRKGSKIPYIIHPLNVATILMRYNVSDSLIAAALLHDVVEDEGVLYEDMKKDFGEEVTHLVAAVSEPLDLIQRHPDKAKTWRERKEHTIEKLRHAKYEVKLLSCADKLANITDMSRDVEEFGEKLWNRFNAPKSDQKWYYTSLVRVYEEDSPTLSNLEVLQIFKKSVEDLFS